MQKCKKLQVVTLQNNLCYTMSVIKLCQAILLSDSNEKLPIDLGVIANK